MTLVLLLLVAAFLVVLLIWSQHGQGRKQARKYYRNLRRPVRRAIFVVQMRENQMGFDRLCEPEKIVCSIRNLEYHTNMGGLEQFFDRMRMWRERSAGWRESVPRRPRPSSGKPWRSLKKESCR